MSLWWAGVQLEDYNEYACGFEGVQKKIMQLQLSCIFVYLCMMSTTEKLLNRFLTKPNDFSYRELKKVLNHFGYLEKQSSGSRVVFTNESISHSIKLHKPHPKQILKQYQLTLIIDQLRNKKLI